MRISDNGNIMQNAVCRPVCRTNKSGQHRRILDCGNGVVYRYRMVINLKKREETYEETHNPISPVHTPIYPIVSVYFNDCMRKELYTAFVLAGREDFCEFKNSPHAIVESWGAISKMSYNNTHGNPDYAGFIDYANHNSWVESDPDELKTSDMWTDIYELFIFNGEYFS